ncbi:MAG: AAA family ATPase [Acidobacteriota bacterium]|nr:MAG: AAA family ATPase [Acidobacteriota bacterium]
MGNDGTRIVLTGFMGVGKSTVARHLARLTGKRQVDLDDEIERSRSATIPDLVKAEGIERFRQIETEVLAEVLGARMAAIISLGGGAWITEANREIIKANGVTAVWLETTFDHCWRNIRFSRKERPLVKNKRQARKLFDERERYYCLADWHFVIDRGYNSFDIAQKIASDVFSIDVAGKRGRHAPR